MNTHLMIIIGVLLFGITIASFLNSVMDTLFDHFDTSIFKNLNPNFWNPNISWKTAKIIWGYSIDAWHISKSIMLWILYVYPAVILHYFFRISNDAWFGIAIWWVIAGILWCLVFNKFFNKILKSK